jgi:hypothetical protein
MSKHSQGGSKVHEKKVTIPQLMLIAGTRVMLGAGIGLLVAGYLNETQRISIGWTLTIVGALLTIPIMMEVFGRNRTN